LRALALGVRAGVLLASAALGACSTQTSEQPASPAFGPGVLVRVANETEHALPEFFEGIAIDVLPGVEYRMVIHSTQPGQSEQLATINGHPFRVEGKWITIGPERYGPVTAGDQVSITAKGVLLNNQPAGPLPPRQHEQP
jgi:hypothetical protein